MTTTPRRTVVVLHSYIHRYYYVIIAVVRKGMALLRVDAWSRAPRTWLLLLLFRFGSVSPDFATGLLERVVHDSFVWN